MSDMEDLNEMPGDPNGPAYQKTETRTGPPLDYVSEKLEASLLQIHSLFSCIKEYVPEDLPQPTHLKGSSFKIKQDGLVVPAWSAFRYQLTAFLALYNVLALANDQGIFDRLLGYTHEQFVTWLDNIILEGSITG